MTDILEYLKSSELVFEVQKFFGVRPSEEGNSKKPFKATNKFFYYLFLLGTELGDEIFYGVFIPFMFFNIDVYLGRRFVLLWFINMYIGQALKEIFRVSRPKSPAIPMQKKWSNEYSLPSTHAMGSLSIGGTIAYFSIDRFGVNPWVCVLLIILWVSVISLSRVYLGMHSILDILLGGVLTIVFLLMFLPATNYFEDFLLTNFMAPLFSVILPVILIIFFPLADVWTPTRGDTCSVAAVFTGVEFGAWFNYQLGWIKKFDDSYPLSFEFGEILMFLARTVIGLAIVALTEFLGKMICWAMFSAAVKENQNVLKTSENSLENTKKNFVDLSSKFITYSVLGFNTISLIPKLFDLLKIDRSRYFSEF